MTLLRAISGVPTQQAIVVGRVVDSITRSRLRSRPEITLKYRTPDRPLNTFRPFPNAAYTAEDGHFAFSGQPSTVFPGLDAAEPVEFQLSVSAAGYSDATAEEMVTGADVTPSATSQTLAGYEVTVLRLDAPVAQFVIALEPLAVGLEGFVLEDNDPDTPVENASVSVTPPALPGAATTDERGYYRIDVLPITESVEVLAEEGARSTTVSHQIDFTRPINQRTVSLNDPT